MLYIRTFIALALCIIAVLNVSCENGVDTPGRGTPVNNGGVSGIIYDEEGKPLSGVKVFYIFNYYSPLPPKPYNKLVSFNSIATEFKFYQNLPNPFSNDTFLRFSLPEECEVSIVVSDKSGFPFYKTKEKLLPGIYQKAIINLAKDYKLKNGLYNCSIFAASGNTSLFRDSKQLCIAGNQGKANFISDKTGKYYFDYNDAFIGDTILESYSESYIYSRIIENQVYLYLEKEDYQSESVPVELIEGRLLNQDIILRRINEY